MHLIKIVCIVTDRLSVMIKRSPLLLCILVVTD
jgi:hypothetical protein